MVATTAALFLALPFVFPLLDRDLTPRTASLKSGPRFSFAADVHAGVDVAIDRSRGGRGRNGQANEQGEETREQST